MIVHMLKSCDTCKKALKSLRDAGFAPQVVDVRAEGVPRQTLARFHAAFGEALVNRRSTTWRGLSEGERAGDPIDLLAAHPTLMKRPVIETDDGTLHLGWGKQVQARLLDRP